MFIYKTQEELSAMTPQEVDVYAKQLKAHEAELRKEELTEATKGLATKEELTAELAKATKAIEDLQENINELKDAQTSMNKEGKSTLVKEVQEKIETIKSIAKGNKGEIEIKALSNRASINGNTNAYVLPTIGQLGVKARALYDVLPKVQLSTSANDNGIIKYHDWDEDTTVRAAEMTAEGVAFDESTAKFKEYTLPLRKIGDTLPVTEEFYEDASLAAAELERFLDVNVQTKIDDQIINGDNLGQNLKGLLASVPSYTPVAAGISGANIFDLARKMRTAIIKPRGSKYNVDILVANSDTIDRYVLAKDQEDNYLFRTDGEGRIAGLTVVEDNNMPDNQMVVGDRRFAQIYEKGGVVISNGVVNEQFVEDITTIKARKRLAMLIRTVDATGFLKCTDIDSALTTLADAPDAPSV